MSSEIRDNVQEGECTGVRSQTKFLFASTNSRQHLTTHCRKSSAPSDIPPRAENRLERNSSERIIVKTEEKYVKDDSPHHYHHHPHRVFRDEQKPGYEYRVKPTIVVSRDHLRASPCHVCACALGGCVPVVQRSSCESNEMRGQPYLLPVYYGENSCFCLFQFLGVGIFYRFDKKLHQIYSSKANGHFIITFLVGYIQA